MVTVGKVINAGMVCGRWYYGCYVGGHNHAFPRRSSGDVQVVSFLDSAYHRPKVTGWLRTRDQRKSKNGKRYFILFAPGQQNIFRFYFADTIGITGRKRMILAYVLAAHQAVH